MKRKLNIIFSPKKYVWLARSKIPELSHGREKKKILGGAGPPLFLDHLTHLGQTEKLTFKGGWRRREPEIQVFWDTGQILQPMPYLERECKTANINLWSLLDTRAEMKKKIRPLQVRKKCPGANLATFGDILLFFFLLERWWARHRRLKVPFAKMDSGKHRLNQGLLKACSFAVKNANKIPSLPHPVINGPFRCWDGEKRKCRK